MIWIGVTLTIFKFSSQCFLVFARFFSLLLAFSCDCSELQPFTIASGFCMSLFIVSRLYHFTGQDFQNVSPNTTKWKRSER